MSAHRWQETSPQGGEASRIVCVVCDVVQVVRYTTSGGYDDARYSFDGATWSTLRPSCTPPAHVTAEQAVRP